MKRMKVSDRFLVVKRAVLTALNPNLTVLHIKMMNRKGGVISRYIHSDEERARNLFLADMQDMFVKHAKSAKGLENMLVNFADGIQDRWNAEHPDDLLQVVTHREIENEDKNSELAQEPCVGVHPDHCPDADVSVTDGRISNG